MAGSAAALAVNIVGFLSSVATLEGFFAGLVPSRQPMGASVSIYTSTGKDPTTGNPNGNVNTGGKIRAVYGYDDGGALLGVSKSGTIDKGTHTTFTIDQGNNMQASYIDIVADEDAVCIPIVSVQQPDDNNPPYGFVGDVFEACGLNHYYGNIPINSHGAKDGSQYMPKCGWIDANHEDGVEVGSFRWYLPAFSKDMSVVDIETSLEYYCHPRAFEVRYDAQPIEARAADFQEFQVQRGQKIRENLKLNELVVSPHTSHSAVELCDSPTSAGPDFVSLNEMVYCDMGTHQHYPLCDAASGINDDCFDLNSGNKTLAARSSRLRARSSAGTMRAYDQITQW